jgi:hypothetical protein
MAAPARGDGRRRHAPSPPDHPGQHVLLLRNGMVERFGPREEVRQWIAHRNQRRSRCRPSERRAHEQAEHSLNPTSQPPSIRPLWQQAQQQALRMGVVGSCRWASGAERVGALAPLSAAVVAEGTVKSVGNRKTVQHAEGGIVSAIHVKDGDRVAQGQTLLTLADARVAATVQTLREQGAAHALKAQRLQAETDSRNLRCPTCSRCAISSWNGDSRPCGKAGQSARKTVRRQGTPASRAGSLAERAAGADPA